MFPVIRKIRVFVSTIRGGIYIVSVLVPGLLTFIAALVEGLPWSLRILRGTAAAAFGFAAVYYALRAWEYISNRYGFRREVNTVADNLQIMLNAGHEYVQLQTVADMWAGDDSEKMWVWNPRLRKLKEAIDAGEIDYQKDANRNTSKKTAAKTKSVITFLRTLTSL